MLIIVVIILISCICFKKAMINRAKIFDAGKDTIEYWGDGEYQLLRDSNKISLFNCNICGNNNDNNVIIKFKK